MLTNSRFGLTGNQLKLIALITMTIDHIGMLMFPYDMIWRIIGRIAMPIFAYMIAEGCRYTRHKGRYLLLMLGVGTACQLVYWFAMGSLNQCILITFSLSIVLIYAIQYVQKERSALSWGVLAGTFAGVCFIALGIPKLLPNTDFSLDYDIFGVLLPVFIFLGKSRWKAFFMAVLGLCLLNYALGWIQWYSLLSLPLLALYNGTRGKAQLKYLFYIYYPMHLAVLHIIDVLLSKI